MGLFKKIGKALKPDSQFTKDLQSAAGTAEEALSIYRSGSGGSSEDEDEPEEETEETSITDEPWFWPAVAGAGLILVLVMRDR